MPEAFLDARHQFHPPTRQGVLDRSLKRHGPGVAMKGQLLRGRGHHPSLWSSSRNVIRVCGNQGLGKTVSVLIIATTYLLPLSIVFPEKLPHDCPQRFAV